MRDIVIFYSSLGNDRGNFATRLLGWFWRRYLAFFVSFLSPVGRQARSSSLPEVRQGFICRKSCETLGGRGSSTLRGTRYSVVVRCLTSARRYRENGPDVRDASCNGRRREVIPAKEMKKFLRNSGCVRLFGKTGTKWQRPERPREWRSENGT